MGAYKKYKNQDDIQFCKELFSSYRVPSPSLSNIAVIRSCLIIMNTIRTMERPLPKVPVACLREFLLNDITDQQDLASAKQSQKLRRLSEQVQIPW